MKNLNRNEKIAVTVGIMVVGFFFVFGQYLVSFFQTGSFMSTQNTATAVESGSQDTAHVITQDIQIGTGEVALPGTKVTVHYVGSLTSGAVFDSSIARDVPFSFILGVGQVIPGWDEGLMGMKVGGKRVLIVPPALGYGSADYGPIPANSTLIFQIELLGVEK